MIGRNSLLGVLIATGMTLFYLYPRSGDKTQLPQQQSDANHVQGLQGQRLSLEAPEGMVYDLWHHFMARYMRTYENEEEQNMKFSIFRDNYKAIYRHNMQYFHK